MLPLMITITERAAGHIVRILQQQGRDPALEGLRIGVESGGCSGFQYKLDLNAGQADDHVFESCGARVLVDSKAMLFLGGSTVDYVESLTGAGFTVRNPNATGTCGCGTSFSV